MTRKRVWRYKCDFCNRRDYFGKKIKTHEAHCKGNADRVPVIRKRKPLKPKLTPAEQKERYRLSALKKRGIAVLSERELQYRLMAIKRNQRVQKIKRKYAREGLSSQEMDRMVEICLKTKNIAEGFE